MTPNPGTPERPLPAVEPLPQLGAGFDFSDPNGPYARFYLRSVHVAVLAFVAVVFVVVSYFPLWHTDVWGHLKYGRWMVENRTIPDREPFSPWWDGRVPFTQFYTLAHLAMCFVYDAGEAVAGGDEVSRMAGGVEALRFLHAFLTAARMAVLLLVFHRLSGSWAVALIGGVAVLFLSLSNLAVLRPQTFAELYFAVLLWPLSRAVLSWRAVVVVPVLMVMWANSHGSYLVGLGTMGVLLVGRALEVWLGGSGPWGDSGVRRLLLVLVLSGLAVAVFNPYGPELFRRTLALTTHKSLVEATGEWQPLRFEWGQGWHWVFMLSLVVVGLTHLVHPTGIPPVHLVLLVAFGLGVALQTRFVIWWAMLVPWVLVPRWAELRHLWPARLTPPTSTPTLRKTGFALLLTWAICMWSVPAGWLTSGEPMPLEQSVSVGTPWKLARQLRHPTDPDAVAYPELAEVLRKYYPGGSFTGTVMATPMQGDYLMWALAPDTPVTYAHMHLFHPDYWEELGKVSKGEPGWWEVMDKYRANLLVMEADYVELLRDQIRASPEWKVVLDESDDPAKPNPRTRQFIAVRLNPR